MTISINTIKKGTIEYPYILLKEAHDLVPIVVESLDEGNVPIIVEHKNKKVKLNKRTSRDALNLLKLFKTCKIVFVISEDKRIECVNTENLMEVMGWKA